MTNSSLVNYTRISPKRDSPRTHVIDTISIHCMAGQLSVESCGEVFQTREASSNYGIGPDGRIGLYVEEKDRSWCTSNAANDNRAVTIEVASDSTTPYKVTDAAYQSLIRLLVDICQRNNIQGLKWKGDKSLIGQVTQQNMTVHRWFSNKACPGDYLYNKHGEIAETVNKQLKEKGFSITTGTTTVQSYEVTSTSVSTVPTATNSSLATYINRLSGVSYTNRTKAVSAITIHSANAVANHIELARMINSSEQGYNYGVGNDGIICLFIDEAMSTPSTGNTYNDIRSVNIVLGNSTGAPDYKISDECYESVIDLCEDICRRNFIYQLKYSEKEPQNYTFTMHCQFDQTDCPGPYIKSIYPKIQEEVNHRLDNSSRRWVTVTKRLAESETAALRVQSTISIGAIKPYVVRLDEKQTDINLDKLREVGVVGVMIDCGDYYNTKHEIVKKRMPSLKRITQFCTEAKMPFGLIHTARATNLDEVKDECSWLYYIISGYPPKLGIWLHPEFTVDKELAQVLVDMYYTKFVNWGLKSKCGIYATKSQSDLIGWPRQCVYMPLWLEGEMLDSNVPQEEVLTPSFFKLDSLKNAGYNPTTTVISDDGLNFAYNYVSNNDGIGEATQLTGVNYTDKMIPSDPKYTGMKKYEGYKSITSKTSYQYKLVNDLQAFTDSDGFRKIDGRYMIAVGSGICTTTGTYLDVYLENGTVIQCIMGDMKADQHTDSKTHIFTVVNQNHCCTEFIVDGSKLNSQVKKMGDCSYLQDSWKGPVVKIRVYQKNWFKNM